LGRGILAVTYLDTRYIEIFWYTQKIPTQKSAAARFARKKLVLVRMRLEKQITRITIKLPATRNKIFWVKKKMHRVLI
jgi:hypothetical protein